MPLFQLSHLPVVHTVCVGGAGRSVSDEKTERK